MTCKILMSAIISVPISYKISISTWETEKDGHSSFLTEEKHAQHADVGAGTEFITLAIRSKAIRHTRCNELLLLLFFPFVFTEVSFHYGGLMSNSINQTHCSYYWKACGQIHLPIFAVVTFPARTVLLGKSNPLMRAPRCSAGQLSGLTGVQIFMHNAPTHLHEIIEGTFRLLNTTNLSCFDINECNWIYIFLQLKQQWMLWTMGK